MTTLQLPPHSPQGPPSRHGQPAPSRAIKPRWPLVLLLIVSLIGAGAARHLASVERGGGTEAGAGGGSPLSRMNSFALALLLGGLRGPLVMVLWTSSESQKVDRNLDDFDTKVEWIRLLQPEFDTVHIFQIWNKAYNISVLKASLANKYLTILDALDYATSVDHERPDDINIIYAIGGVYFDKLGSSQEKGYYNKRVRAETLPHKSRQHLSRSDAAWRRLDLDPVLDEKGNLLPKVLTPTRTLIVDPNDPARRYDGSELPFLAQYQPFPDGISPLALGYNYYLRAELLQSIGNQKHAQLSELVVDSRPAQALRFWGEEETERARRLELEGFAKPVPTERLDLESPAAAVPVDQPLDPSQRPALEHARAIYTLAARIATDSIDAYNRHLLHFQQNIEMYRSHLETLVAEVAMNSADRDYLAAVLGDPAARPPLLARAAAEYHDSIIAYQRIILHYYVPDNIVQTAYPKGYDRSNIDKIDPSQYGAIIDAVKRAAVLSNQQTQFQNDVDEYLHYLNRAQTRLNLLGK